MELKFLLNSAHSDRGFKFLIAKSKHEKTLCTRIYNGN